MFSFIWQDHFGLNPIKFANLRCIFHTFTYFQYKSLPDLEMIKFVFYISRLSSKLVKMFLNFGYLFDGLAFGDLRVSDHLVGGADLDKGELWVFRDLSCQRCLPTVRWALKERNKHKLQHNTNYLAKLSFFTLSQQIFYSGALMSLL